MHLVISTTGCTGIVVSVRNLLMLSRSLWSWKAWKLRFKIKENWPYRFFRKSTVVEAFFYEQRKSCAGFLRTCFFVGITCTRRQWRAWLRCLGRIPSSQSITGAFVIGCRKVFYFYLFPPLPRVTFRVSFVLRGSSACPVMYVTSLEARVLFLPNRTLAGPRIAPRAGEKKKHRFLFFRFSFSFLIYTNVWFIFSCVYGVHIMRVFFPQLTSWSTSCSRAEVAFQSVHVTRRPLTCVSSFPRMNFVQVIVYNVCSFSLSVFVISVCKFNSFLLLRALVPNSFSLFVVFPRGALFAPPPYCFTPTARRVCKDWRRVGFLIVAKL